MTRSTVLVATWADGLFAVTGDTCSQELAKESVRGLAADGRGGALAIVGNHSLRRRALTGQWETIATSDLDLACCMTVRDTIYVGTNDARMLRLSRETGVLEPIESFGNVAGRESWFGGSAIIEGRRVGPPLGIRSVAAGSVGAVLFANVHVGGIPRSTDGGETWEPTIDIHKDVHEVSVYPRDSRIVAAAAAVGLCISRDSGETWTVEREGLHAPHCSAVAFSGEDILVSASSGPFATEGRIYRRPVQPDGSIRAIEGGLPPWLDGVADTGCIAAIGSFIAIAANCGALYQSDDFGHTWSCTHTGLPAPSGVLIC
jgi:hypothetical protein